MMAEKQTLQKELAEVLARNAAHQKRVAELKFKMLVSWAKPRPFGELQVPQPKQLALSEAEKLRLRSASAVAKQALGKFIGVRVSDYKQEPVSFVVEISVIDIKGKFVGPYYVAFQKKPDNSYKVLKSRMPHMIITLETKDNFPLKNDEDLRKFVRELRVCCEAFVDRRDQINEFSLVHGEQVFTKISYDVAYLFVQLDVALDNQEGTLRLYYQHNKTLPHKFQLNMKDPAAQKTWKGVFDLLYEKRLVEALELLTEPKEAPPETDSDSVAPIEPRSSQNANKASTSRKAGDVEFKYSDSSDDDANRSMRMRRKKAKIGENIKRKTYWGKLSGPLEPLLRESDGGSSGGLEAAARAPTAKTSRAPRTARPRKRAAAKPSSAVASKKRKASPPPVGSDSELSAAGSVPKDYTSERNKNRILAPIFRQSAARDAFATREPLSPAPSPRAPRSSLKQPHLAAIFHKTRRSLLLEASSPTGAAGRPETSKAAPKSPGKQAEPNGAAQTSESPERKTTVEARKEPKKPVKKPTSDDGSKTTKAPPKSPRKHAETSKAPQKSLGKQAKSNGAEKTSESPERNTAGARKALKKPASDDGSKATKAPPKSLRKHAESNEAAQTSKSPERKTAVEARKAPKKPAKKPASDDSSKTSVEPAGGLSGSNASADDRRSETVLSSGSLLANPRKVFELKMLSQESGAASAVASAENASTKNASGARKSKAAADVRDYEEARLAAGRLREGQQVRRSPRKKDGGSTVGLKKAGAGSKKAASNIPVREKKGSQVGSKKAASNIPVREKKASEVAKGRKVTAGSKKAAPRAESEGTKSAGRAKASSEAGAKKPGRPRSPLKGASEASAVWSSPRKKQDERRQAGKKAG